MLPENPGIYVFCRFDRLIVYVGSAKNLSRRYATHMHCLRKGNHPNQHLQHVYSCYGEGSLQFVILEELETLDILLSREQHYIDTLEPPYNIVKIAGSRLGTTHTEETKKKMSMAKKGKPGTRIGQRNSPEATARAAEKNRGRKPNENQLRGLAMARVPGIKRPHKKKRGPHPDSHRANLRKAWVKRKADGKGNGWNKGMPASPEHLARMRDPERLANMQNAKKRHKEAKIAAELAKSPLQFDDPIEPIDPSTLTLRSLWDWAEEQDA